LQEANNKLKNLKSQAKVVEADLLPQDFKFHKLVLEKLDRDLEELGVRRHTELLSGQQTPLKMSPVEEEHPGLQLDGVEAVEIVASNGIALGEEEIGSHDDIQTTGTTSSSPKELQEEMRNKSAWELLWEELATLSGFHDPEDMK
jgi:hypothetical protein